MKEFERQLRMSLPVMWRTETLCDGNLGLDLLDFAPHPVHKLPTYFFRMAQSDTGEELGRINLRVGSNAHIELYAGHVGYAVHPTHQGHRYAARSLQLLRTIAGELGINPLWITCDPENIASRRTCEIAGAHFVEIVDVPEDCVIHRSGHKQKCRYRLDVFGARINFNKNQERYWPAKRVGSL